MSNDHNWHRCQSCKKPIYRNSTFCFGCETTKVNYTSLRKLYGDFSPEVSSARSRRSRYMMNLRGDNRNRHVPIATIEWLNRPMPE